MTVYISTVDFVFKLRRYILCCVFWLVEMIRKDVVAKRWPSSANALPDVDIVNGNIASDTISHNTPKRDLKTWKIPQIIAWKISMESIKYGCALTPMSLASIVALRFTTNQSPFPVSLARSKTTSGWPLRWSLSTCSEPISLPVMWAAKRTHWSPDPSRLRT